MKPPRVAEFLLHLLVPREERSVLLGDLEETFAKKSGRGAKLWFWRETILAIVHANARAIRKRPTLVLGTMGFAALFGMMSRVPSLGGLFFFPLLMFAMAIALRVKNIAEFSRRFAWTLTAFMVPMLAIYVMVSNPAVQLWGYAWRLGFVVGLGAISASIVAAFSSTRSSPFLPFPFFPVFAYAFLGAIRPAPPAVLSAFSIFLPGMVLGRHYLRGSGLWFAFLDLLLWSAIGWALMNRLKPAPEREGRTE